MGIAKDKRAWLIDDLGLAEEAVEDLERNLKELGDLAHDIGLQSKEAADEEEYDEEYDEEYEDEEGYDEDDVEYDEDEQDEEDDSEKARSSRRPRTRDKPSVEKRRGYLWTGGRPQSGSTGSKRDKPSSFAGRPQSGSTGGRPQSGSTGGRPQSGSTGSRGSGKRRGYLWTGGRPQSGSTGGRGGKKPSSFAGRPQSGSTGGRPQSGSTGARRGKKKEAGEIQYVTREEMAAVIAELLNPILEGLVENRQLAVENQEAIIEVAEVVKEMSRSDADRIANVKEQTPSASLRDLIQSRISIGREEARIDGRTQLAKEGPQESEEKPAQYTPSGFINGLMSTAIHGTAQDAQ